MSAHDALIEFHIGSIDAGVHNRPAIRHYSIQHSSVRRIDPLALRPRDFVDEWVTHDWTEAALWSEDAHRPAMRDLHKTMKKGIFSATFLYPTMHCPARPDLWQVGVDLSDPPTPWGAEPKGTYFLVRWRPPYRFTMVDISARPFPGCTEKDPAADDAPQTLFPNR